MNKQILRLAIPNIVTTLTVPLLGMVDLAIVGHMGSSVYIGAIALGTMIFNMIYWNFGFLRMGTSGLTAQAFGAQESREIMSVLARACSIGWIIAFLLLLLQKPLSSLVFRIVEGSPQVEEIALQYFRVCIWAAPATLGLYAFKGWFIGMQNAKTPMWIAIFIDVSNIAFSVFFVYVCNMKIQGVALGTVLAQYCGLGIALFCWWKNYHSYRSFLNWKEVFEVGKMLSFFRVNADIFLRTLCLIAVFTFIPAVGAKYGDDYLSANTLLMQFFTLFSYIMDGFAYAGESLVGKYVGARNNDMMHKVIRSLFYWGLALSALFVLMYACFGNGLLHLFTDKEEVVAFAQQYYVWVLVIPFVSFAAFLWDGILIGAMASQIMRNVMFISTAAFFAVYYIMAPQWGNHALWLAFMVYLGFRGLLQALFFYGKARKNAVFCKVLFLGIILSASLDLQGQSANNGVKCLYDSAQLQAFPLYTDKKIAKEAIPAENVVRLKLKKIPADWESCLGKYPNLQELHLANLRLKSVPAVVFRLSDLTVLDLSKNKIDYMPPELGNLVNLRELHINRNPIAYLPRSISRLHSLELLDIWNTNITELPNEVSQLSATLKTVNLLVVIVTEKQKTAMMQLLPNTEFLFSPSCGCGE